jgi:hypothetical protein
LEGYGAIVYRVNGEWFIGRFNDGDMRVAMTTAGIFFASTKDAIMEALSYAGITVKKWLKVRDNHVYRLTHEGLTKAYKVDAMGTRLKWNDDFLVGPSTPRPATATATATATDIPDSRWDDQCDYCGAYGVRLYVHGKRDAVCADCYYEATDEIPVGFDGEVYQ